jgi:tetraacyldisaccharide 4'-kinase
LGLFSGIYRLGLECREFLYESGIKKIRRLPANVISIGNITLGGTGKTPAVIALAQEAQKRGFKPCILTRGYKGKAAGPCLSSRDNKLFKNTAFAGDEAVLMSYRLRDVPIVKGRNRFLSGVYALGELGRESINVFILDDGFQHRSLYRDMDIVLIDATTPFGNEMLFPDGILREPLESLKRADIVVITKSDNAGQEIIHKIEDTIKQYNPDVLIYSARHKPVSLIYASGKSEDLDFLSNRKIYAFSAIANHKYFISLLKSLGASIIKSKAFRDHYNYSQRDINKIHKEAGDVDIVITEKDLMKLNELKLPEKISALRIDFSIDKGFYEHQFGSLKNV